MANEPLESIKFPGIADTFTVPAVDNTLAVQGAPADAKKVGDEISDIKADLSDMQTATAEDVGKALLAKTVTNGKVTEWKFGEAGGEVDPSDIEQLQEDIVDLQKKVEDLSYGLDNLTPYNPSLFTAQYATVETAEYEHGYTVKATGYGSATPRLNYTLTNIPDIATADIMYLSFEIYIDAETSEYTSNLYQPKCFGHQFSNVATTAKQWTKVQLRYTQNNVATALGFNTGITFASTTTAKDKMIHLRNLVCVDLTKAYGAGKEPALETMNSIVEESGGYFERYNLFDAKGTVDDIDILQADFTTTEKSIYVNYINAYMQKYPQRKNDGTEYSANASGVSVSVSASDNSASIGDIIYMYGEFKPYSALNNCNSLEAVYSGGRSSEKSDAVLSPQNDQWYPMSMLIGATSATGGKAGTFVCRWESATAIRMNYRHIVCINLTKTFGKYNEPTKYMLDEYFKSVSDANAINFASISSKMFNISAVSRALTHPYGSYVILDDDGNIKGGSTPNANWSGWGEIGTYGQNKTNNIPIYNKFHGTVETDGMMSVVPIYGCWSDEASSTGNPYHGGHVFHGWTTDRKHRITIVQNIYSDNEAAVFNYIPGDKSETAEGVFLPLRLGADNVYKGVLLTPYYDPKNASNYRYTRMTIYGVLNIARPQNYDNIPSSSSADGIKGDIVVDENYVYVCTATNTWKRIPLATW